MRQQQQQETILNRWRQQWNLMTWLCLIHVAPVEVFLRKCGTMGSRYPPPLATLLAIPWLLLFPVLTGAPQHAEGVYGLGALWFYAAFVHNGRRRQLERKGCYQHSRFKGFSVFGHYGYYIEPLTVTGAGFLALVYSPALGVYLVLAAVALLVNHGTIEQRDNAHIRALRDAVIEQEVFAEKLRRN